MSEPDFKVTYKEASIFTLLKMVSSTMNLDLEFRVAGGWVRDKLLGKDSDDIDIALDKMTGRQFWGQVHNFCQKVPEFAEFFGKTYTIEANVEKSKHLETVAIEVHGEKIDFANLRSEKYGEDSRIPIIDIGTPETDAQRRDLTINAIFLNINTGKIEDYVGGLEDLKAMRLRTPLDPKKTFRDDPLRMLRVLRLFSRFEKSTLDENLVAALADPECHESYKQKVSPERAGPEILKLLAGAKPAAALRVMFNANLHKVVFDVPETRVLVDLRMNQQNKWHAHNLMDHSMLVVENIHKLMVQENAAENRRVRMLLAAVFHDMGKAHPGIPKPKKADPTQMGYKGHDEKSVEIAEAVMKNIGVPADDRNFVNKIIELHMRPHVDSWSKKTIGRFMRDCVIPGQDSEDVWRMVMLHGIADEMSKGHGTFEADVALKQQHIQQMKDFLTQPGPSKMKPLLDGNALMAMFPAIKVNRIVEGQNFIKFISERLLDEQANGTVSTEEQAKDFVEGMKNDVVARYGAENA